MSGGRDVADEASILGDDLRMALSFARRSNPRQILVGAHVCKNRRAVIWPD